MLCKGPLFSRVLETCIFLSTRYYRGLPRYYRVRSARYYRVRSARYFRTQRGSNFLLPPGGAVLPPLCSTSARAVLPHGRGRVGVKSGQGEFQLPHTHSSFSSHAVSLCRSRMAPETLAGSPSPAALLGFRPVGSFPTTSSCHGTRFLPKSLSLWFVLSFLGFSGDACCS